MKYSAMADDINIGAPDGSQNPDAWTVMPLLSVIKTEIPSDDESFHTPVGSSNMPTSSITEEDIRITVNAGVMDISCLHDEIDLGTEVKIEEIYGDSPAKNVKPTILSETNFKAPKTQDMTDVMCIIKPPMKLNGEITDDLFEIEDLEDGGVIHNAEAPFYGNRIILGNKNKNDSCIKHENIKDENENDDGNRSLLQISSFSAISDPKSMDAKVSMKKRTEGSKRKRGPKSNKDYTQECHLCNKKFKSPNYVSRHVQNVHGIDVCDSSKKSSDKIDREKQIEKPSKKPNSKVKTNKKTEKDTYCTHCHKVFPNAKALIEHMYEIVCPNMRRKSCDLEKIRSEVLEEVQNETRFNNTDLDKIREEVIREAESRLGIDNHSVDNNNLSTDNNNLSTDNYNDDGRDFDQLIDTYDEENDEWKCQKCDEQLDSKVDLAKHELEHTNLKARIASDCVIVAKSLKLTEIEQLTLPTNSETNDDLFEYNCRVCKETFDSSNETSNHIEDNHPDKHRKLNIQKVNIIKEAKRSLGIHDSIDNPPLPKDFIFKCKKCNFNFLTMLEATIHLVDCKEPKKIWSCPKCHNCFKLTHQELHEKQHLYSDKIVSHEIDGKESIKKVLCECPECGVQFSEVNFWRHYRDCGTNPPNAAYCRKCDIIIDSSQCRTHERAHNTMDTEDFITVRYEIIKNDCMKRKHDDNNGILASKKKKIDSESDSEPTDCRIQMLYCGTCKSYFDNMSDHASVAHFNDSCQSLSIEICDQCGLTFTNSLMLNHAKQHKQGFSLSKVAFYDLKFKQIDPPYPPFPRCPVCLIYFFSSEYRDKHSCYNTVYKTCYCCNTDFEESCHDMHLSFHSYSGSKLKKPLSRHKITLIQKMLLSNEENLFTFYQCIDCNVALSEKRVKSHQESNCIKLRKNLEKCLHCKLMLNLEHHHEHVSRHRDKAFNQSNMNIVPFDRHSDINRIKKLIKADKQEVDDYRDKDRRIKIGESDQIKECASSLDDESIGDESSSDCEPLINLKKAKESKVSDITNDKSDDINEYTDVVSTNERNKTFDQVIVENPKEDVAISAQEKALGLEKLYKSSCGLHFMTEQSILEHLPICKNNCDKAGQKCPKCNISFTPSELFNHLMTFHAKNHNPAYKIVELSSSCLTERDAIYKCGKCNVHFLTESFVESHVASCNRKKVIPCKNCGLKFDKSMTRFHKNRCHGEKQFSSDDIDVVVVENNDNSSEIKKNNRKTVETDSGKKAENEEESIKTVFKCIKCDLHFLTAKGLQKHVNANHNLTTDKAGICKICNLKFAHCDKHVEVHHDLYNLKAEDLVIKNHWLKNSDIPKDNSNPKDETKIIYFCSDCDIYFFAIKGLYEHVLVSKHDKNVPVRLCEPCGRHFSAYAHSYFNAHIEEHHNKLQLKSQDFLIKTYPLSELTSADKKYSDKLYKCSKCSVCFMNRGEIFAHKSSIAHCPPKKAETCYDCNLLFALPNFYEHRRYHHDVKNFSVENIVIINGDSVKSKKDKIKTEKLGNREEITKIYKCVQCAVHFMRKHTCLRHVKTNKNVLDHHKLECEQCKFVFHFSSMKMHKRTHHRNFEFEAKDLVSIEYYHTDLEKSNASNSNVGNDETSEVTPRRNKNDDEDLVSNPVEITVTNVDNVDVATEKKSLDVHEINEDNINIDLVTKSVEEFENTEDTLNKKCLDIPENI